MKQLYETTDGEMNYTVCRNHPGTLYRQYEDGTVTDADDIDYENLEMLEQDSINCFDVFDVNVMECDDEGNLKQIRTYTVEAKSIEDAFAKVKEQYQIDDMQIIAERKN